MTKRRHAASLGEPYAIVKVGPVGIAPPRKLGAPAEFSCRRGKPFLQRAPQPGLRADAADEDDLASGFEHAGEFVESRLGVWHGRDDVLRHHRIKGFVRKAK